MRKLVLSFFILAFMILYGTGCNPASPPPAPQPTIEVTISSADRKTTLPIGKETGFDVGISPQGRTGEISNVSVHGDKNIQCEQSLDDMFTWYCTATDETQLGAATVFADVTGESFEYSAKYRVEIVPSEPIAVVTEENDEEPTEEPTQSPTQAPTETPMKEPTKEPAEEPTQQSTSEAAAVPSTPGVECALVSLRPPIEGPLVNVDVAILSPRHCAIGLDTSMTVGGTYTGDLTGQEIWILIYPTSLEYFPQSPDACKELPANVSGGKWNTNVAFGGPPQQYDVVAVVTKADSEASIEFKRWLKNGCDTGDFPGYSVNELPDGLTELAAITVSTEKESTGEPSSKPTLVIEGECPFNDIPFRASVGGPPLDVEVNITSIPNCADNLPTASSIPLTGTYSGDLTNKELWILVYPPDLKYYPQTLDACTNVSVEYAGGQWSTIIRLGREGVPEAFHIVAVVTDIGSPASEAFHKYLTDGCSQSWGSVNLIPPSAIELDAIIVHTR